MTPTKTEAIYRIGTQEHHDNYTRYLVLLTLNKNANYMLYPNKSQ